MPTLSYQGIGPRLVAQIIDSVVLVVLFLLVGFALSGSFTFEFQGEAAYPFLIAYGLIVILYYAILEGTMGATFGKKLVKIKVVKDDGSACGIGPAFVRTLLRFIDALPFLYIIGLVLIARSEKKQRLGDRLARTVVVKA
ncbi:MAG: RDD family protein [Candidatus Bathyarchaeia archaeon]|jgi:uncharacterized RDD family membrane protein YckC